MASRKRKSQVVKSKKPRVSLSFTGWLWVLAMLNLGAGLLFSRSTAPTRVLAYGMRETDRVPVEKVLSGYVGVPWARLNVNEIAARLSRADWVESAEFSPNVFGRASVRLTYRKPLARLVLDRPVYLDKTGSLYYDSLDMNVRKVKVPGQYLEESIAIIGQWPRSGVTGAVSELSRQIPQLDYSLELDAQSVLSLDITDGPRVVLGSPKAISEKIKTLASILSEDGQGLNGSTVINLTVPDRPMRSNR